MDNQEQKEALKAAAAVTVPPSTQRADAVADPKPDSSASSSSPTRVTALEGPLRRRCPGPRRLPGCRAGPYGSTVSSPAPAAAAAAPNDQLRWTYGSGMYTYVSAIEVEAHRRPRADYMVAVQKDISANMLQLLGVAAMVLAAKYEGIRRPHVEDFCYITDITSTKEEVIEMEGVVLKLLKRIYFLSNTRKTLT